MVPWDFARALLNYDTVSFAGVTSIGFFTLMWELQSFFITLIGTAYGQKIDESGKQVTTIHYI